MKNDDIFRGPPPSFHQMQLAHETLASRVGRLILAARYQKKWTQSDLAKRAGTTQSFVAQIENSKVLPSLELIDRIAAAFETAALINFASMPDLKIDVTHMDFLGVSGRFVLNGKSPQTAKKPALLVKCPTI